MAYGLLANDMIERFLLHYFGFGSAHAYTRGTVTTPEASHPDRDVGSTDYVAAGVMMAPTYLKWMLLFEEPNSQTVWLAKALPRSWLEVGAGAVVVRNATTRYGRASYSMQASSMGGVYSVRANVSLPPSFATTPPPGGLRLRLRAPAELAGKLSGVTVAGKKWMAIDRAAETVDFDASSLGQGGMLVAMEQIVATWG
jgi:hypothetical protein